MADFVGCVTNGATIKQKIFDSMKFDFKDSYVAGTPEISVIPVMHGEMPTKVDDENLPENLPVLALRNVVLFPGTIYPVTIGREKSKKLVIDAEKNHGYIGAVPQVDLSVEDPVFEDLSEYGTVARVMKVLEMPDGTLTAILQAFSRFRLMRFTETDPYIRADVAYVHDIEPENAEEANTLCRMIKDNAVRIIQMSANLPHEAVDAIQSIDSLEFIVNFIATTLELENFSDKIALLSMDDIYQRAMKLLAVLDTQLELQKLKMEINQKVKTEIDQQQREYFLNNQLRTIQEELGMDEEEDFDRFRKAAEEKLWAPEIQAIFEKEMTKLERQNPSSPEYSTQYNYIQFMLDLPWENMSQDNLDLKHAQEVLDTDHYGLETVKERIIEYLAVLKLKGNMKSPILCLYGPPGVGKTSLGKSIARALGRKYVRIALGGVHDESEIRGHRKTYIGALPGRILSAIAKVGTSNPVIVLDEIDKLTSDVKGDPSSALLEALDPEQNTAFHDNYLDIDYDLSNVMFITTANTTDTIQPALKDRMEMINVSGYLAEEKVEIARNFILPKQLEEHGLTDGQVRLDTPVLEKIIDEYTRESGVRGLEKQIAKIARVTAKKIALGEKAAKKLKTSDLKEYLGLPINYHDMQKGNEGPGVVTGLAWTAVGGEILFIESSVSSGKGNLSMTGNLGDVMKESATIAYQYIKAHPELIDMDYKEFAEKDIHVHVPEGAVPKDGPSAGITMVSSMVSAFRRKSVRNGIAMTGEMTLRGRVLPVGGIKEKILAAKRSGIHTIIISEENRKDVEDIKDIYIKGLTFVYVKTIDDVLKKIF